MNVNVRAIHKLPQLHIRAAEKLNAVPLLTPSAGYLSSVTGGERLKKRRGDDKGYTVRRATPVSPIRLMQYIEFA